VLEITIPAVLGEVFREYAGATTNRALREASGERADDATTWSAVTRVRAGTDDVVTILPYCLFRSRGCAHLAGPPFRDQVLFHHEFDTRWRRSFWHNYLPGEAGL